MSAFTGSTLAGMATMPAWVAWQQENREDGKPTKIPYSPNGRRAKADQPGTWGTRAQAEARAAILPKPFGMGGVGLAFCSSENGMNYGGIDLDSCRDRETGLIEDWATDVINQFGSYTEISPSGTGVKIFFSYATVDLPKLQAEMGTAKFGKQFKRGGGDHPPAIELHIGNRYFCVTDQILTGSIAELRHVETRILIDLIKTVGPTFARSGAKASAKAGAKASASSDHSRSAIAFRKGMALRRSGATFEGMVDALLGDPETTDWTKEKGTANNQRELKRIWGAAAADAPHLAARQACFALRDTLAKNNSGAILPTHANLLLILKGDPLLSSIVEFNSFSGLHVLRRPIPVLNEAMPTAPGLYPRPWDGDDVTRLLAYVQKEWAHNFKKATVEDCLLLEGRDNEIHDVRDYINCLKWNGKPRLDMWLTHTFGCKNDEYHKAVGSKLLIAAVRRVRQPGCKFDHLVVFEGAQGIGKSTAILILFSPDWITDQISDLSKKDAAIDLRGKWGVELPEIEHLIKADVETVKAFLSRSVDHYRPPFGKTAVDVPRQCVLVGTTNANEYLRDATGNRRIWPVKCLSAEGVGADLDWVRDNRDQLWAEAAHREAANEVIWLDNAAVREIATAAQAVRMSEDPWEWRIKNYCDGKMKSYRNGVDANEKCSGHSEEDQITWHMKEYAEELRGGFVTVPELLDYALSIPTVQQNKSAEMRAANILKAMKWEKKLKWSETSKDNNGEAKKKPVKVWFPALDETS